MTETVTRRRLLRISTGVALASAGVIGTATANACGEDYVETTTSTRILYQVDGCNYTDSGDTAPDGARGEVVDCCETTYNTWYDVNWCDSSITDGWVHAGDVKSADGC